MFLDDSTFRLILENLDDGVAVMDGLRRIRFWNRAAERITGIPARVILSGRCAHHHLQHFDADDVQLCQSGCPLDRALLSGEHTDRDVFVGRPDGERVPVRMRVSPLLDPSGEIRGAIELFTDNSGMARALEMANALHDTACTDPLTGLGNRRLSEFQLTQEVERQAQHTGALLVGFVDIDLFKLCNDRHGHARGDQVLQLVAATLRSSLRGSDFLGRWGGEEFLFLLAGCALEEGALVAERSRALVQDSPAGVTVSIGLTPHRPGEPWTETVARADRLMYQSKQQGRNQVTAA